MTHRILVAVDGSEASEHALEYAAKMARDLKDSRLTLFHVGPTIPAGVLEYDKLPGEGTWEEKLEAHREQVDEYEREEKRDDRAMFAHLKSLARKFGLKPEQIDTETCAEMNDIETEILMKAQRGDYEAICLGHEPKSGLGAIFKKQITSSLLEKAKGRTLWIVE